MDLNLARKWRSRTFDGIVGQSLATRMLKNSLYLDKYFPVYLFSGQRGCGKTTTARVFAAAVNCEQLSAFQKDPRTVAVPCGNCVSCTLLKEGRHPDFIEIDAASHTGVDNVRQIIEAASLLPLVGRKKIYLIDEAHMLSKAAFNAFLKILEEPPVSVFFMLATTDPQKIIDTVRSRCFQVFFHPIESTILVNHLKEVCTQEQINFQDEGLLLIAMHTEGSARDAINLLERVRFAYPQVNRQSVMEVLGHVDDEQLIELLAIVAKKDVQRLFEWFSLHAMSQRSAQALWEGLVELIRATVWYMHGTLIDRYRPHQAALDSLADQLSLNLLTEWLTILYEHELLFAKTKAPQRLLETVLIKMCNRTQESVAPFKKPPMSSAAAGAVNTPLKIEPKKEVEVAAQSVAQSSAAPWNQVVHEVAQLDDPLLISLFKQARFIGYDPQKNLLEIALGKDFVFFSDWFESTTAQWKPIVEKYFSRTVQFKPHFIDDVPATQAKIVQPIATPIRTQPAAPKAAPAGAPQRKEFTQYRSFEKRSIRTESVRVIDVSDKQKWQKAQIVLKVFPGTISEVQQ